MTDDQNAGRERRRSVETLSFEDALAELEGIVRRLEQGAARLEDSIESYKRGEALRQHCEKLLARAQGEVEKITRRTENDNSDNDNKGDNTKAAPPFARQKLSSL